MATVAIQRLTADEFWEFANRPENQGKWFELERGEVVEVPSPGEMHGVFCAWITHLLWSYVLRRKRGAVGSNDMGLLVEEGPDTVRGPDVVLFGETKPFDALSRKYSTRIPQLVVEVLSPKDRWGKTLIRIGQYLRRGVPLVWVVDPESRTVSIHRSDKEDKVLDETEELTGEDVMPDFRMPVAELFTSPLEETTQTDP